MEEERKIQTCRFYVNEFPEEDDLVVVEVVNVEENASYVSLLEYNRTQGMITPNELTTGYKQSIHKALKLGKQEVARVLRVDQEKGYIDLSKRKVPKEDELKCLDKFAKSKQCNAMLIGISEKAKQSLDELYKTIIWPLYEKYNHPIDAFQHSLNNPKIIEDLNLPEKTAQLLNEQIARRLQPQSIKVKAEFELTCSSYEGVNAIKAALKAGEKESQNNCKIKFYIVGSPVYSGAINTSDKNKGIQVLNQALQRINEEIQKYGGSYKIIQEPKIYGEKGHEEVDIVESSDDDEGSEESDVSGMGSDDEEEKK